MRIFRQNHQARASVSVRNASSLLRNSAAAREECITHYASRVTHHAQSGIALVIVMISIFVLSMLAAGFAYSMKVETRLARNSNSEVELEWMGRSAVEYCRWVLGQQLLITQEPYDALNQVWAGGAGGIGTSNSPLADVQKTLQFPHGSATWKIVDLERKININLANENLLQQALLAMGVDAGDMAPIIGSILDWIDPDDKTHQQGAESDYYQGLEPSYEAKNGPIDDLSELLLIKGITPDLYWGGAATNHYATKYQPRSSRFGSRPNEIPTYTAGLSQIFTPLSRGQVNINTAEDPVLFALLGGNELAVQKIKEMRSITGEDGQARPFGSPGGPDVASALVSAGMNYQMAGQFARYFTVRSFTFEVTVDAEMGGYKRQFVAILGRNSPKDIQVLSFHWK